MKKMLFTQLFNVIRALKIFVISISSISLSLSTAAIGAPASNANSNSPLLSRTQDSKASVARLVAAIKLAAGGDVNGANAQIAIHEALAGNPGATLASFAAAVNSLGLSGDALKNAVEALSDSFGASVMDVASTIISDSYINGGKSAAGDTIVALRESIGDEAVDNAIRNTETSMNKLTPDQLNQIQTAAGGAGGVYNG